MKNAIVALIVVLSTACVSATRLDTLERRNAALAEENARFRRDYASRPQQEGRQSTQQTGAQQAPPKVAVGGQASTGTVWAYQKHGVYVGTVGANPRQVTQGRKIKLDNQVCDGGSRNAWSNCWDKDDNGSPDLNTWLAFEIDGQPVVCDSGFFHPESQVSLLPPAQACHVEVGRTRTVKLTIKAYRNSGTASYVMLDSVPFATSYRTVSVGDQNVAYYGIDETRF